MAPSQKPLVMTTVPTGFASRKHNILQALSVPDKDYKDLSPKGSVDEGIKELITSINAIDGLVTTSSCAGRVSVFLEGKKIHPNTPTIEQSQVEGHAARSKGLGGSWLFISHDPISISLPDRHENISPSELFHLTVPPLVPESSDLRLIKFQFEPMVCRHPLCT